MYSKFNPMLDHLLKKVPTNKGEVMGGDMIADILRNKKL
jgi:hypothetical protein